MKIPRFDWDNKDSRIRDETRKKLLFEKVLELTLDQEHRYSKFEIGDLVNRSHGTIWKIWQELCTICKCEHYQNQHTTKCTVENCICEKFIGKLEKDEMGRIIRSMPTRQIQTFEDISKTKFIRIASIQRWIASMQKTNVVHWRTMLANFWRVCITIDTYPDSFLQDIDTVEKLKDEFVKKFRDGKAVYIYEKKKQDPLKQSQANPQSYLEAIRSFRDRNGKDLPKGYLKIERDFNQIYAHIHLNDDERRLGIHYLKQIDEKLAKLFILQLELGVRIDTLFKIKPEWIKQTTVINGKTCEYFKCLIHEKKQNQMYEKLIITPEAREIVRTLQNFKPIHNEKNIREAKKLYNKHLRGMYAMLGKIASDQNKWKKYERGTPEWYFVNETSHVNRHSCVHKLMRLSGERAEVVASFFWDTPDTLKIYKKSTIDTILQQGVCLVCNPPTNPDPRYERFCSIPHALFYYST